LRFTNATVVKFDHADTCLTSWALAVKFSDNNSI